MRAIATALLALGCAQPPDDTGDEPLPPNFLVVVFDDLGVDNVGAYGEHPSPPATPTIDRLAEEGVLFRRFYTNMLCTPSRASLMTGLQPYDNGVPGHLWPWDTEGTLPDDVTTVPEALDGYHAGAVGKWHLGGVNDQPPAPSQAVEHGFTLYSGQPDNFAWGDGQWETYAHYLQLEGAPYGSEWSVRDGGYATSDEVDAALDQTERLSEPWIVWLGLHAPHLPVDVPPPHLNPRGVTAASPEADIYDAMVEAADIELGRLLDSIDPEMLERTTVFVVGDNGTPHWGAQAPDSWQHAKDTPFEGGIRAPLIVAGAGVPWAGEEVDTLVSHVDLLPTLVALSGDDAPSLPDAHSFASLLADPASEATRDLAYVELVTEDEGPDGVGYVSRDDRAAVGPRYKLIRRLGVEQLYDLGTDPDEGVDLLGTQPLAPHIQAELAVLRAEMARHDALAGRTATP